MKSGRPVAKGTPQSLLAEMEGRVFEVTVTPEEQSVYDDPQYKVANVMLSHDRICLRIVSDVRPAIGQVRDTRPNLEDVYLYLAE